MNKTNLVLNPGFHADANQISYWAFHAPRPELSPKHDIRRTAEGSICLAIESNGDKYAFGWWRGQVKMEAGKWYKASVRVRLENISDPSTSIIAQVAKHFLAPKGPWKNDMILEQMFKHKSDPDGNNIEMYLRAAPTGCVEWSEPSVTEIPEPSFRMARVATVRFGPPAAKLTLEGQRNRIAKTLDHAGGLKPDIVAFTEWCHAEGLEPDDYTPFIKTAESVPDGPTCRLFSSAAKKYKMYVLAGILESRKGKLFNTAVIFDRNGNLVGQYDKTHLTFPEIEGGISCGNSYPIFELDFGKIAVHICYDEWFPEVSRYYAHAGAQILFLSVMGGKPITWRTRALDNNIYVVAAATNPPSMIIDSSGTIIAQTHGSGIVCADLNMDWREVNVFVDPTLIGGVPCAIPPLRNVIDNNLLHELEKAMKQ